MEEYMEAFEYDNSEPQDAWWNNEAIVFDGTVSGNASSGVPDDTEGSIQLEELLETLTGTSSYGTMGDYYNQMTGCYVFPDHDVYAYFIDTDADGADWTMASDGHYVPAGYLEAYEGYISTEEPEPEEYIPTENEIQNLETLESVRGILSVIKENDTSFYDEVLEYQQETLALAQETRAIEEDILYGTVTECVLIAITAGAYLAHVFFSRMRVG